MDLYDELLTLYLVLEALAMRELPKLIQRSYSRHAQYKREAHGVQEYHYRPLNEGEIRLLVIKRSSWMLPSVIEASLLHVSMDEILAGEGSVEFEAISYCWGSADRVDSILIDRDNFRVTESAFNVLMARRSMFKDRTLWIDAICINQSDTVEKMRQIQMMREIYGSAHRVLAIPNFSWQARLAAKTLIELKVAAQISWIDVNELGLKFKAKRSAVVNLLTSEYFSRAWIIQEVALGKDVEVYMSGVYMPWHQYMGITTFLFAPHRRHRLVQTDSPLHAKRIPSVRITNVSVISMVRYAFQAFQDEDHITLEIALLFAALYFDATDPRDKVFSVLGMVMEDVQDELLNPDYSKHYHRRQ